MKYWEYLKISISKLFSISGNAFFLEGFADVRLLNQEIALPKDLSIEEKTKEDSFRYNTMLIQRQTEDRRKICYWENRWATGNSQWHKKEGINPFLDKYFDKLQVITLSLVFIFRDSMIGKFQF